ncbi:MAG: hypothetical protein RXP27_02220 [Nitrososphaeria archaeon]
MSIRCFSLPTIPTGSRSTGYTANRSSNDLRRDLAAASCVAEEM